jgi:hypothetical protein
MSTHCSKYGWAEQLAMTYNWTLLYDYSRLQLISIYDNHVKLFDSPSDSKSLDKNDLMQRITTVVANKSLYTLSNSLWGNIQAQCDNHDNCIELNKILIPPNTLEEPGFVFIDDITLKSLCGIDMFNTPYNTITTIAQHYSIKVDAPASTKNRLSLTLLKLFCLSGPFQLCLAQFSDNPPLQQNKEKTVDNENVSNYTTAQLHLLLQSYGLPELGSRELLIARLAYFEHNKFKQKNEVSQVTFPLQSPQHNNTAN